MHPILRSIPLPELVIVFLIALIIFGPGAFRRGGPFSR
jgi:Sec-independent protein translocase protein TatA